MRTTFSSLLLLAFTLLLQINKATAQKDFIEGTIVYKVVVDITSDQIDVSRQTGTYTLSLKGDMVRKDIKMDNGYTNTIIINNTSGTVYSLQTTGGTHYAVQLDYKEFVGRQAPYERFTITPEEGTQLIAGHKAGKASISYSDGNASVIYLTDEWKLKEKMLYERFPGITHLPLSYEIKNEKGMLMNFTAVKIDAKPVATSFFRVPQHYKIISNQEYKQMSK